MGNGCDGGSTVELAWDDALAYCDSLTWGSHDDWRLPDRYELQSIVDFGTTDPAADPFFFPQTSADRFWSSSTLHRFPFLAWFVHLFDGLLAGGNKGDAYAVRCVRGGRSPDRDDPTRFVRSGGLELVVTDSVTELQWQGCLAGLHGEECPYGEALSLDWQEALQYCENLEWDYRADWRLPNIIELTSIVDDSRAVPAIDPIAFPGTLITWVWSSSLHAGETSHAWYRSTLDGHIRSAAMPSASHVRCVRSGS